MDSLEKINKVCKSVLKLTEKEIEIFKEFKEFLKEFNDDNYSTGDAMEALQYFHDRLEE